MLAAFPTITRSEFTEACQSLEFNCAGRLDGTSWLSVKWDGDGALHIKKQYSGKEQRQTYNLEGPEFKRAQTDAGLDEAEAEAEAEAEDEVKL
jgi:hypothetical protein